MTGPVVGLDFDNTIVAYDELMARIADEEGWLDVASGRSKRSIRDELRGQDDGEQRWRRLQALAYGARIGEARLHEGVHAFFARCRAEDVPVHVVSHKSVHAAADPGGVDLRAAAQAWLVEHGLYAEGHVHFEDDRVSKLRRVGALGCTHFVDDLEETFLEPSFPAGVERLLFRPDGAAAAPGIQVCRSWQEIEARVLDGG